MVVKPPPPARCGKVGGHILATTTTMISDLNLACSQETYRSDVNTKYVIGASVTLVCKKQLDSLF